MSKLTVANKTLLETVLDMGGGYVLDFTNTSLAQFFDDLGIDIYEEKYAEYGVSKANRLRTLWKVGSDSEVSLTLIALADYMEAKTVAGGWDRDITADQVAAVRSVAGELAGTSPGTGRSPATITTEATVTNNKIQIEIHEDIYAHIGQYLTVGDYFHAVEESYKLVREKLCEITGKERATDAFASANIEKLFGHQPANDVEKDFFEGVKFLNMSIQFLRNEKAHTPATPLEPNLALHYVSLASLAYDLITRYVSEETIEEVEELVRAKRHSYRSASAFYRAFEDGKWIQSLTLPADMSSASVRRVLKEKWLKEADFTRSWDYSNVMLMRLELVADVLTQADVDGLLDRPTRDSYGNDQEAGMLPFLQFIEKQHPGRLSNKAKDWIAAWDQR